MENKKYVENSEFIIGRNAVREAIKVNHKINYIMISNGTHKGSINEIIQMAKENKILIKEVNSKKLDILSNYENHQGIIASVAAHEYSTVEEILKNQESPFIIIIDNIEDPHNLGAIIRTAECIGASGIIIPNRRCASLSFAVSKVAAGALEHIKVARVTNIAQTIDLLKKKGIWIYGADMQGQACYKTDLTGPIALVIGNEGHGISKLVKEKCDVITSIPMYGQTNSLNASVAAGILMYEISRQRHIKIKK